VDIWKISNKLLEKGGKRRDILDKRLAIVLAILGMSIQSSTALQE
jgi:hypothetical protein